MSAGSLKKPVKLFGSKKVSWLERKDITVNPEWIVAMVIEGHDAVETCRSSIGATNPVKAAAGTIRGEIARPPGSQ